MKTDRDNQAYVIELEKEIKELNLKIGSLAYDLDLFKNCHQTEQAERRRFQQALEDIKTYCTEQNLKADMTACEILNIISEVMEE